MSVVIAIRVPRRAELRDPSRARDETLGPRKVFAQPRRAQQRLRTFTRPPGLTSGPPIASSELMSAFARELVTQVEEGIRVLRIRDGLALTEAQIHERAANIVTALMGLYDVRPQGADATRPGPFAFARWAQLRHLFHRALPPPGQLADRRR